MVTGRYTAFSNNKKMETILHRELEQKVEKVQHMKLEVMPPKTILLASPQTFFSLFPTPTPTQLRSMNPRRFLFPCARERGNIKRVFLIADFFRCNSL